MFWNDGRARARFALMIAFAMTGIAAAPATARTVVIKSIGPVAARFPRGMVLPARVRIELGRLDAITLLDDAGTRAFRGPVSVSMPLPPNRYRVRPVLAGFLRALSPSEVLAAFGRPAQPATGSGRRSRLGARRAAPSPAPLAAPRPADQGAAAASDTTPNLWLIDPQQSGTFCLPGGDAATILNRWPGQPLQVGPVGGSPVVNTVGSGGGLAWPAAEVPIANGRSYALGGGAQRAVVRIMVLDGIDGASDPVDIARRLAAAGCDLQLERLAVDAPINGSE